MSPTQDSTLPRVLQTSQPLRDEIAAARRDGKRVGLVPTMGALHDGHLSLAEACRGECDFSVVSVFVNPAQFAAGEDFSKYPRNLDADLAALAAHQVDVVFAPQQDTMYAAEHTTYVDVGRVAEPLEGTCRPGHFRGVATVVLKLFNLVAADVAYFGQKDYQQTLVVRQMVRDLDLPIEIRVCPIVREPDGLALSSRNMYLSPEERQRALSLSGGLQLASEMVEAGERNAGVIKRRVLEHLTNQGKADVDYVALVRDGTVDEVSQVSGPTVIALAARFGTTRLIDNRLIGAELD